MKTEEVTTTNERIISDASESHLAKLRDAFPDHTDADIIEAALSVFRRKVYGWPSLEISSYKNSHFYIS